MNQPEPQFLTLDQVRQLQERCIREHGGTLGVRDPGMLQSALGAAENTHWYGRGDVFDVAAAYAFHIAEAQAFLDGNKRVGVVAALTFLDMNVECRRPDPFEFHQAMIDVSARKLDKPGLAAKLRTLAVLS